MKLTLCRLLVARADTFGYARVARNFRTIASHNSALRTALASECPHLAGSPVRLAGWVQSIRAMGGVTFVLLRDSYDTVQLTINSGA